MDRSGSNGIEADPSGSNGIETDRASRTGSERIEAVQTGSRRIERDRGGSNGIEADRTGRRNYFFREDHADSFPLRISGGSGLRFKVKDFGSRVWIEDLELRFGIEGSGVGVEGLGFGVLGLGSDLGYRI